MNVVSILQLRWRQKAIFTDIIEFYGFDKANYQTEAGDYPLKISLSTEIIWLSAEGRSPEADNLMIEVHNNNLKRILLLCLSQ